VKRFCLTILVYLTALCLRAQTNLSTQIEKLLPSGKCHADLMEVSWPARFKDLSIKMQAAISTNKDWWMNYVKENSNAGGPLPYSPKIGLTQEEYEEFLSVGEKRTLEKVQTCTLQIKTNNDVYEFDGGEDLSGLTGLKVDIKTLSVVTPFGILKNPEPDESPAGPALGEYSGFRWKLEKGDVEKGNITTASFLLGKLKTSGRNFIYYKGGIIHTNNPISNLSIVIFYDKK
jgi:hypothetical protein